MITPLKQPLQVFCIALLLLGVSASTACNRNKECKAIVTVLRQSTGEPLSGVTVELTTDPGCGNCIADLTATTDGSGKASFTTDLPKILDVEVVTPSGNVVTGKVVRFEEGETDELEVELP
jgi:hypothetical protein